METRANKPVKHGFDHLPGGQDPIPGLSLITEITSTDGSIVVTNPFGPITDLSAALGGQEILDAVSTPGAGASATASFSKRTTTPAGATLLDLTTPTAPAIITSGVYAFSCWLEGQTSVVQTNEAIPCTLILNLGGGTSEVIVAENYTSGVAAGEILSVTLAATWYLTAGMTIQASLVNSTARAQTIDYALYVQRIR